MSTACIAETHSGRAESPSFWHCTTQDAGCTRPQPDKRLASHHSSQGVGGNEYSPWQPSAATLAAKSAASESHAER